MQTYSCFVSSRSTDFIQGGQNPWLPNFVVTKACTLYDSDERRMEAFLFQVLRQVAIPCDACEISTYR